MSETFGWPDLVAGLALVALAIYAVTGGADFGAGLWDRVATGPRKEAQRHLIETALSPIWETNHVWLIFVLVLLFSGFPAAFAAVGVALPVPLSLALLGIVLRGAAFVFRQYGQGGAADARRWGRIFGIASLVAPFFLGVSLAAVTGGQVRVSPDGDVTAPTSAWWGVYPIAVGLFVVALHAWLAAVYLAAEAASTPEVGSGALADDFRRRAIGAGLVAGALSLVVRLSAERESPRFANALFAASWSTALQMVVAVVALAALAALWLRRHRLARALAVIHVGTVVLGWGVAQHPYAIAPDLTLRAAAAPEPTLQVVFGASVLGTLVLIPALLWLFRIFKSNPPGRRDEGDANASVTPPP